MHQDRDVEAGMAVKVTELRTRLLSLPSTTVPSSGDVASIAALLIEAERCGSIVSSACDLVASLCDRGDVVTDVKTREALGSSGVVSVLTSAIRAWMDTPDVLWHCVCALAAVCGGKKVDSRCEGNLRSMMSSGDVMELLGSLLSGAAMTTAAVAQWAIALCWRLAQIDEYKSILMVHVGAAMSAMARHGDVAAVAEYGLQFLVNEAFVDENRVPLMAHVGAAMSAMARHASCGSVCRYGLYFISSLSEVQVNVPALKAAGVAAAVRPVIARHGSVDDGGVKRFGEVLLSRVA